MIIQLEVNEFDTVLAALRFWAREGILHSGGPELDIAEASGKPLTAEQVGALCERINTTAPDRAAILNNLGEIDACVPKADWYIAEASARFMLDDDIGFDPHPMIVPADDGDSAAWVSAWIRVADTRDDAPRCFRIIRLDGKPIVNPQIRHQFTLDTLIAELGADLVLRAWAENPSTAIGGTCNMVHGDTIERVA